ncbi:MAG: energy-coupling factor transporter ATPase [Schwartzia sp.]|nr:energy-coupling factor transporter ATPase [Schwartzia sp. (in: firmicutes)]
MSIEIKNISYTYMPKTAFEHQALKNVSFTLNEGEVTAIAGHTGSGKSTIVQHLNGLLHPTDGQVLVDGTDLASKGDEAVKARQLVGLVFQYPEHQLFEETVAKDVGFGPKNLGVSEEETEKRVREALEFVDLDYDVFKDVSPFQLSGGQKRRVAIAGVLALKPKYLVLDEPTAGLDPRGREELLSRVCELHKKKKVTLIFVSHKMEDVARIADRLIVMNHSELVIDAPPRKAFLEEAAIKEAGLDIPVTVRLLTELKEKGFSVDTDAFTIDETAKRIARAIKERGRR